jgi:predicted enzyme related to lactoylglutathione lyase
MKRVLISIYLFIAILTGCNSTTPAIKTTHSTSRFTGRSILTLYTNDVVKLARFYRDVLGFEFLGYWDYDKNGYVSEWVSQKPPIYAGFKAAGQKIGLHKATDPQQEKSIGTGTYYFEVNDLLAEYNRIKSTDTESSRVIDSPGLKMFFVTDLDGRRIYFAANQKNSTQDFF